MAKSSVLNPMGNDLDPFLQASVGDDANGQPVSVLSTLARLGVDPWEEGAALTALSADAARARFALLLEKIRDVPTLGAQIDQVARRLILLLPNRPQTRGQAPTGQPKSGSESGPKSGSGVTMSAGWRAFLILIVVIVAVQVFVLGMPDF